METIRFKSDSGTRRRLYTPESFSHPAKGHLGMWAMMIEKYSSPGDLVLDPMGGSGATLLAALMGRRVCIVELEEHFIWPMQASWAKMQQHPMLGYTMGQAVILRGDARHLPLCSADSIITSPPFQDQEPAQDKQWLAAHAHEITSGGTPGVQFGPAMKQGYTRAPLPPGGVDSVISSPPYQETHVGTPEEQSLMRSEAHLIGGLNYGTGENIGNQRGQKYWDSMALCYAECWRVLRPGGIMALVLKGFTHDGKYVDLPGQTEALLLAAGWEKHDAWRRELWSLSFWRILQKRRDPAAFDERLNFEEVLAFRKPAGAGNGVAAVLTSPPYEGSAAEGPSGIDWTKQADGRKKQEPHGVGAHPWGYSRPSAVIMSPPYEGIVGDNKEGPSAGANEAAYGRWAKGTANEHTGYTRNSGS